ncbi:MAG: hypothetical protein P4L51_03410 [Puia sp.]|nr:hypothetical protein [Puia sp.]
MCRLMLFTFLFVLYARHNPGLSQAYMVACSAMPAIVPAAGEARMDLVESREAFVNQVFRTIVDSSFSTYLLVDNAYPCSFIRFEYDEWVKYALHEDVPIYVLNELAAKSFADRDTCTWRCDGLVHAICIGEEQVDSVLDPAVNGGNAGNAGVGANTGGRKSRVKILPERKTVFYFSRPLFTDDGNYAILDMDFRCDNRLCGIGSTCLFRKTDKGWRLAGRKQNW